MVGIPPSRMLLATLLWEEQASGESSNRLSQEVIHITSAHSILARWPILFRGDPGSEAFHMLRKEGDIGNVYYLNQSHFVQKAFP